jgi:hypothetical protein
VSTEPKPKLKQKAPTASFSYRGGEDDDDDDDNNRRPSPTDGPKVGDRIEVRAPPGGGLTLRACAVVRARARVCVVGTNARYVECGGMW